MLLRAWMFSGTSLQLAMDGMKFRNVLIVEGRLATRAAT
jgi:hypothetical protein